MIQIRDMLYVRSVERRLGRSFSEAELLECSEGEGARIRFPDGHYEWIIIPKLSFPWDLISLPKDLFESTTDQLSVSDETPVEYTYYEDEAV